MATVNGGGLLFVVIIYCWMYVTPVHGSKWQETWQLEKITNKVTKNRRVMSLNRILLISCCFIFHAIFTTNSYRYHEHKENDLSLWINEQQVKILSGFSLKVFIINYGWVSPHVKDPNFSTHLPLVPSEVGFLSFFLIFHNFILFFCRSNPWISPGRVVQKNIATISIVSYR